MARQYHSSDTVRGGSKITVLAEGSNSIIFQTQLCTVLYEKLSNTIHRGEIHELRSLHDKVESANYHGRFEADSLRAKAKDRLRSLILNVTEDCNLACSYCIYSGKYDNERGPTNLSMDSTTAKAAIDLFVGRATDPALISFYGGEPLCEMDLISEVVQYTRGIDSGKQFAFSLTSNFCDAHKHMDAIVDNELFITISLDGPSCVHDKKRHYIDGRPTYDRIMTNLKLFEERHPGYAASHFSYNSTCVDSGDLPDIIRFFSNNSHLTNARINGVERKGMKRATQHGATLHATPALSDHYLELIMSDRDPGLLRGFFDRNLMKIATRDIGLISDSLVLDGCCFPGNRKLFAGTDGTLYMCERFGRRLAIGSTDDGIRHDIIDEIIERFLGIRNTLCTTGCWAQCLCAPCIHAAKDPAGDISVNGLAQTCESSKSQLLVALAQYVYLSGRMETLNQYVQGMRFR